MSGHLTFNMKVFRRCVKTDRKGEDAMSDGSLFYKSVLKTGNARLTTVVRQQDGTVRQLVDTDPSLCRVGTSATEKYSGHLRAA